LELGQSLTKNSGKGCCETNVHNKKARKQQLSYLELWLN